MLNNIPLWDKKITEYLKPYSSFADIILILIILITIHALTWNTQYKLLWIAYLLSP